MHYVLVGDIGGTHPRFAMMRVEQNKLTIAKTTQINRQATNVIMPINNFLQECAHESMTTDICCIAVAGPVTDNACYAPTNATFQVVAKEIQEQTLLKRIRVMNDFAAVGYAIANIDDPQKHDDIVQITAVTPDAHAPRATIGPGTGLGVAYMSKTSNGYNVIESEGGHASLDHPVQVHNLVRAIKQDLAVDNIAAEALVSGQGIFNMIKALLENEKLLYELCTECDRWLVDIENNPELKERNDAITEKLRHAIHANDIVGTDQLVSANAQGHPHCHIALKMFMHFLGLAAQNVALNARALGGLFIGGGIVPKNMQAFTQSEFLQAFRSNWKPNICNFLEKIPVYVIKNYDISFYGCVQALQETT